MKEREAIAELKSLRPSEEAVETILKALERAKKRENVDYTSIYLTGIYDRDSVWEERIDKKIEEYDEMIKATYKEFTYNADVRRDTCREIKGVLESLLEKKCKDIQS